MSNKNGKAIMLSLKNYESIDLIRLEQSFHSHQLKTFDDVISYLLSLQDKKESDTV